MLQQDLAAHEDQHHAAQQLGLALVLGAEHIAHLQADGREDKGDHANEQHRPEDIHPQEGKGDAHGQGIDAGGNGQGDHGFEGEGIVQLFLFLAQGLADHVAADEAQQHKGDPMVDADDEGLELGTQQVADEGHQRLKAAEVGTHAQGVLHFSLAHGKALANGHGKGVHAQANSDEEQFQNAHGDLLLVGVTVKKSETYPPFCRRKKQISLVAMYKARSQCFRVLTSSRG